MKPAQPSHVYRTMVLTAARLVLHVDAGKLDGRPKTEPVDGADGGSGLQLLEHLHANGDAQHASRGADDPALVPGKCFRLGRS
jgi:hypothetical protein